MLAVVPILGHFIINNKAWHNEIVGTDHPSFLQILVTGGHITLWPNILSLKKDLCLYMEGIWKTITISLNEVEITACS